MKKKARPVRPAAQTAAVASAVEPAHESRHDHLVLASSVLQREFYTAFLGSLPDPDSKVTVTCTATPNPLYHDRHDRTLYSFLIQRATANTATPVTLSLLTLGLQATSHTVTVRALRSSNNDAEIVDHAGHASAPSVGAPVAIPPTGLQPVMPGQPDENPIESEIGFLRFSGAECRAEVFAVDRSERGIIRWVSGTYASGHDNTPPPGEPN